MLLVIWAVLWLGFKLVSGLVHLLVIAGMMTHMCIDTTTRAAADLGFENVLAHDACATRDLGFGSAKVAATFSASPQASHARGTRSRRSIEYAALGLQAQAGCPVTFSRCTQTIEACVFQVVVEYSEESVGRV